jgi:hypothetical protein
MSLTYLLPILPVAGFGREKMAQELEQVWLKGPAWSLTGGDHASVFLDWRQRFAQTTLNGIELLLLGR